MPAIRRVDADQSCKDQVVLYLLILYHLWFTVCYISLYGVLAEYQEVYPDTWGQ